MQTHYELNPQAQLRDLKTQALLRTHVRAERPGTAVDFSKASQDKLAMAKLSSRHALSFVQKGDIKNAIPLLRNEWASLPGASQSDLSMDKAQKLFDGYVAELSKK